MASLTIDQIASLAQVSPATVSRVLNGYRHVRPVVRDRVLGVIREHNYIPHPAAQSLARNRSTLINLYIPRSAAMIFTDPFFPRAIQGITEACAAQGYSLMISLDRQQARPSAGQRLHQQPVAGTIVVASDVDDPILPQLMHDRAPLVLLGNHPYFQNLTTVDVDNRAGAHEAVNHLIGLGHRRIALITGPLQAMAAIERRDGYKQAILEAELPLDPALIAEGDFTEESGRAAMIQLLRCEPRPSAVFVSNDTMAVGAIHAIHEAGLAVPGDIALVGFDDMPMASYVTPSLTTVRQPVVDLGATAATRLIEMIDAGGPIVSRTVLPTTMIVRQSSGGARPSA